MNRYVLVACAAIGLTCGVFAAMQTEQQSEIDVGHAERALSCAPPTLSTFTETFTACGVQRTVLVAVPTNNNATQPSALYVGLHGLNGTSATIEQKNVWYCLGAQEVSLFPQGVHQGPPQNGNGWDIERGGCDDQLISEAIVWAEGSYNVNEAKVRCYGFSMGSLECQVLAMAHPTLFDAIALVSTEIPWTQSPPSPNTFALDYFQDQGAQDATFPIANGRAARDAWLAASGGYSGTFPGYDAQFTGYAMTSTALQATYGECPTCGHGWYPDTTPAMAAFFIALGL